MSTSSRMLDVYLPAEGSHLMTTDAPVRPTPVKRRIPLARPWLRKLLLTIHITAAVGWVGAILTYLVVNIVALSSTDDTLIRGAYLLMEPMLTYAITPLAVTSLVTGVVLALVTPWGLWRHRWVANSLWLTILAVFLLIAHTNGDDLRELTAIANNMAISPVSERGDLPNTIGGLFLVSIPLVLNVYKPRGLTRYGRRLRAASAPAAGTSD